MGRLGWLGPAATLRQRCPCLTQSPCTLHDTHTHTHVVRLVLMYLLFASLYERVLVLAMRRRPVRLSLQLGDQPVGALAVVELIWKSV